MNAHGARTKRIFIMLMVALTLATGGIFSFEAGHADAGYNLRCALIDDEIDYARCVGLPPPQ